jgi:hypothetical protein
LHLKGAWSPPSFIRLGGCSSLDFDDQDLPLLVFDPISSLSSVGMLNPIIPFSSTILNPFALSFFPTTTRL